MKTANGQEVPKHLIMEKPHHKSNKHYTDLLFS